MTNHKELVDWAYSVMPTPKTTTETMPFKEGDWVYQPKIDGKRCIAVVAPTGALLLSKNQKLYGQLSYEAVGESGDHYKSGCQGSFAIYDCELLSGNLWVFDTFVLDGKKLSNLSWTARRSMSPSGLLLGRAELRLLPSLTSDERPSVEALEELRAGLAWTQRVEGIIARRESATLGGRPTVFKQKP